MDLIRSYTELSPRVAWQESNGIDNSKEPYPTFQRTGA